MDNSLADDTFAPLVLLPARGLMFLHGAHGARVSPPDAERWMRLNRFAFKTSKLDVVADGVDFRMLPGLLDAADGLGMRLSLRTTGTSPSGLDTTVAARLLDVAFCMPGVPGPTLAAWGDFSSTLDLPLRLMLHPPYNPDVAPIVRSAVEAGVKTVMLTIGDPFMPTWRGAGREDSLACVASMEKLTEALTAHGIEADIVGPPWCVIRRELHEHMMGAPRFHLDHQGYDRASYALTERLFSMGAARRGLIILMLLGRHTSFSNPIDDRLLPWLIDSPWLKARIWALHKLTRHLRLTRSVPAAAPDNAEAVDAWLARRERRLKKTLGLACAVCSHRRVCDHMPGPLRSALPGIEPTAIDGAVIPSPLAPPDNRTRYFDTLDQARLARSWTRTGLAEEAVAIIAQSPPSREFDAFSYAVEGVWSWQLAGTLRWFSWTNTEQMTTPIATLTPPFTLEVTFGGGIAEYIGFSFGRHAKLMAPMVAYSHRLALHVVADGRYVLLRDGCPVEPVAFTGAHYIPERLGSRLEPRISIWNIDGTIGTQAIRLWQPSESATPTPSPAPAPTWSVIIVCTRFSRRLQASLLAIAAQDGVALERVEVIVAHVPGIDATGDVIENIELSSPGLRVVRAAFAPEHANAKGFLINECVAMAKGEWVILLDADIVLSPRMFAAMDAAPDSANFIIPDGRKMLSREATAAILLGQVRPWAVWDALLSGPGEYRRAEADGVPVGFCQCVRRSCFETVHYEEMNHFEGADWRFGKDIREHFGMEHRLSGIPVLHLDHGASNWYGAPSHR